MSALLSQYLADSAILVAPGVYDAFGALFAQQAGFKALYLSGASIAYTRLGRSDIGLVDRGEVAAVIAAMRERVELPLMVDADTGFGNALNVIRTVKSFERAGANAIQLEDQTLPKRCGHLAGKTLISPAQMVGKLHAALDARNDNNTLIIARTDAIAVEGFKSALERAERYLAAGADVLFIEAPHDIEQMHVINRQFGQRVPLLANMVEGGKTPLLTAAVLQEIGYAIAIFPGGLVRALAVAAQRYFATLQAHGSTAPLHADMLDFAQLNTLLGISELLEMGQQYNVDQFGS